MGLTVDDKKKITLPTWVVNGLISLIIALITAWGMISARAAATEIRLDHIEKSMANKVEKDEFRMVVDELREIKRILMEDRK
jgi:hypothetical protein